MWPSLTGEQLACLGGGELSNSARAENGQHRGGAEVLIRRHNAGECAEKPVGLRLVAGDGGEDVALAEGRRAQVRQLDCEVIHRAEGTIAPTLMLSERGSQGPPAAESFRDGSASTTASSRQQGLALLEH